MKTTAILASVAALSAPATAVTIQAFQGSNCAGSYFTQCSNVPQNSCCVSAQGGHGAFSGKFLGLPTSGTTLYGWSASSGSVSCGILETQGPTNLANACFSTLSNQAQWAGLSYVLGRSSKRRAVGAQECTQSVEPDTFVLNGHEFDLTGMNASQKQAIYDVAAGGADVKDIPADLALHAKGTKAQDVAVSMVKAFIA